MLGVFLGNLFTWAPLDRSLAILLRSVLMVDLPAINVPTRFSVLFRQNRATVTLSSPLSPYYRLRNVHRMSFDAPVRVVLRSRLTLIRLTLIRNPWSFGVNVSHIHYRYSCLHLLFTSLHNLSQNCFADGVNAPLPIITDGTASAVCLTPAYYPRRTARLVSCYALFR